MQLDDYFDFLGPDARDAIRIKGHRIGIEHVLSYYHEGYNPDEIAQEFPGLSLEKIYATITYYLAHRDEVDAYLARLKARYEQEYAEWVANPSPLVERLRALRAQQAQEQQA
jgi:uncharacterized protein (DUF433 family)